MAKKETILAKALLWFNGLAFLAFGVVSLLSPEFPAGLSGIELKGADAPIEVRAQYGGIFLAIAMFAIYGALKEAIEQQAILMLLLVYGGLAGGRLLGLFLDPGPAGNYTYSALTFEVVFTIILGFWLFRSSREVE